MQATKAHKKEVTLSVPLLQLRSGIKSVLSHWSRAIRGSWRRNVTRYLEEKKTPQTYNRVKSRSIYTLQMRFHFVSFNRRQRPPIARAARV